MRDADEKIIISILYYLYIHIRDNVIKCSQHEVILFEDWNFTWKYKSDITLNIRRVNKQISCLTAYYDNTSVLHKYDTL